LLNKDFQKGTVHIENRLRAPKLQDNERFTGQQLSLIGLYLGFPQEGRAEKIGEHNEELMVWIDIFNLATET